MAPIAAAKPRLMAASRSGQRCPFSRPIAPAAAAPRIRAIWLGPDEDSSPNSVTDAASRPISNAIGASACARPGARGIACEYRPVPGCAAA